MPSVWCSWSTSQEEGRATLCLALSTVSRSLIRENAWEREREKTQWPFFLPIPGPKISWSNSSRGGSLIFRRLSRSRLSNSVSTGSFAGVTAVAARSLCNWLNPRGTRVRLPRTREIGNARNKPTLLLYASLWRTVRVHALFSPRTVKYQTVVEQLVPLF